MKFLIFVSISLLSAFAQSSESYVQGVMGFESGAVNIGFDYESRESGSAVGYGAYFLYSDEEAGASPQVMSFGAMSKIHFYEDNKFDLSLAPGFGISLIEAGTSDETVLGPMVKIGLLYKFSDKVAFGGEIFKAYNWLSDEFGGSVEYFNFAIRLKM